MNVPRAPRAPHAVLLFAFAVACGGENSAETPVDGSERLPGGDTTNTLLLGINAFKSPAENATAANEQAFFSGNSFFNSVWVKAPSSTTARDGLGPLFNARSCSGCHFADGRGRPPLSDDEPFEGLLLRIGTAERGEHGEPSSDPVYGGQLQPFALDGVPAEGVPRVRYQSQLGEYADGTPYELLVPSYSIENPAYGELSSELRISPRVAPIMIGLGLLEAVSDERLLELEDPDDRDRRRHFRPRSTGFSTAARPPSCSAASVGKPSNPACASRAPPHFLGDIGITSSLFPGSECTTAESECLGEGDADAPEIDDLLLGRVETYTRLLAPPIRQRWNDERTLAGRRAFSELGCASCHTPRHVTGDAPLLELSGQVIYPYTDLLLHDLGPELSDGRPAFDAEGGEWRTPPLWGIGRILVVNGHERLLHDGRARGVAEAILWHGGEAEAAREAFRALAAGERENLIEFVESL